VGQVPAPLQETAGVKTVLAVPVATQEAAPQLRPLAACVQAPAPLQVPVLPQAPPVVQRACGSATPLATLLQVPSLPATLQARQVAQLAVPQHTPSTQLPLLHSCAAAQVAPLALTARQLPPVPEQ
jgi:hypothetical protein